MPTINPLLLAGVAALAAVYFTGLDWLKVWLFARLELR
jgi:hypothetical protein